jgi:peptide/nickel transport system ATP-binding protein
MTVSVPVAQKDMLVVQNLKTYFPVRAGVFQRVVAHVKAVDDVSFTVREGETFGLVGESGCGKTTVSRTILRLIPATEGSVFFDGQDVFNLRSNELKALRRNMQIVFPDPYSSLDPRMPVGDIIAEGLLIHGMKDSKQRNAIVQEMLAKGGPEPLPCAPLPARVLRRPTPAHRHRPRPLAQPALHRLRRAGLGAGCLDPVADSQPAQGAAARVWLLLSLCGPRPERGRAHQRPRRRHVPGQAGGVTTRESLYEEPLHPYTQALLSAIPTPNPRRRRERIVLKGEVPSPLNPPSGCRFHPRCPIAKEICSQEIPVLEEKRPEHYVACHLVDVMGKSTPVVG